MLSLIRHGLHLSPETPWSGRLVSALGEWGGVRRRCLLALGLLVVSAQAAVLAFSGWLPAAQLWSDVAQTVLGLLVTLALLGAGARSSRFGKQAWSLAALAFAVYTVGQAIFAYSSVMAPNSMNFGAFFYDPIFFFWVVPLLAAAVADPVDMATGFEWTAVLDVSLLVLLALALHFSIFVDARWQAHPAEMLFWRFKVRLFRDLVVLACLWARFFLSGSSQVRALFLRLATFYSAYALCNVAYLLARQATGGVAPPAWMDLMWSLPRLVALIFAATWNRKEEIAESEQAPTRWRRQILDRAPMVVPVLVITVSAHMFMSAKWVWGWLILATLVIVSLRLKVTQSRQDRAVARWHSSTNLLHSIIEGTSEIVYLKDAHGHYLLINSAGARLLRRQPEEIVGKTDYQLFPKETADAFVMNDRRVMESGNVATVEEPLHAFGSERIFLTTKNPYRDSQGKIIGVLGLSVDITEHRRLEQNLQKAQRMESIGTFSSGMAHDFNNLLTVIKGYTYLAHADAEGNEPVRESLDQINKASSRAASLIDQLLAFSRQKILQPRLINLNDIVAHLSKMLDRLIGEDVRVETRFAVDLGTVKADPGQIEQVLMNLAANARDAMPIGGVLTVTTANVHLNRSNCGPDLHVPPGSYVCLTVSDNGTGMDARTRARIFEPFFTTKPVGKGTGLGLATVYGIIQQSGGYLAVQSELGLGTTFRIYLPRVSEKAENLVHVSALAVPLGGHQTILVVDDDAQVRRLASHVLTRSGFSVLEAESGEHAERVAAECPGSIDLLLTDVVMPGASGPRIAKSICSIASASEAEVLYMSGYPNDALAHLGVHEKETRLLMKPFSPARLVTMVREVLQDPANAESKTA